MPNPYDVDDILEEIKRKKTTKAQSTVADVPASAPAWNADAPQPLKKAPEPSQPAAKGRSISSVEGLTDFFGSDARFDIGAQDRKPPKASSGAKQKAPTPAASAQTMPAAREEDLSGRKTAFDFTQKRSTVSEVVPKAQIPEEPVQKNADLEKTQLNIPLFTLHLPEEEEEQETDLGRTQPIPTAKKEVFDFEVLQHSLEEDFDDGKIPYAEDPPKEEEPEEDIDDFRTPADIEPIRHDLDSSIFSLNVRLVVVGLLFFGSLYLALAQLAGAPLPAFMDITAQPRIYVVVNLAMTIVAALVCNTTVGGGLASLLTMHADGDSLAALAVIATIIQGGAVAVSPEELFSQNLGLFFVSAIFGLLCNVIGKKTIVSRIAGNFALVSDTVPKKSVLFLKNKELARELSRGLDLVPPNLVYGCPARFESRFLEKSYEPDSSEGLFRIIAPVVAGCCLIVGGVSYYLTRDLFTALTAFSAVACVVSPLTTTLYANYPLYRAQKALNEEDAQLTGFDAVDTFSMVNGVTVDASELFPSDNVLLHNIKMFEKRRIDEAILDASSALCSFDGTIKNVFMKIIQGNTGMLKKVENLVYEEGMGISAWVDGKRVLIGNSALMRHHEIFTPSADYEEKYRAGGRDLIYLSNSGELTAMFVISYQADPEIAQALYTMERKGISLIVKSTDPNLTAEKIAQIYDLPLEMIRVISSKLHSDYEAMTAKKDMVPAGLSYTGDARSLFHGITAAISVKGAINLATVMQVVGILLGFGLMAFFSLLGAMQNVNGLAVVAFQMLWGTGTMLFSNMRRI